MLRILKVNYAIVGGGFSAFIAKTFLKKSSQIYFPENHSFLRKKSFFKAPSYKVKKIFNISLIPYVNLTPKLKFVSLHAHQLKGGNTNIWGGFINIKKLPANFQRLLKNLNILTVKINQNSTGSSSNNSHIYQLQMNSGHILNVSHFLISDKSLFLHSISVKNKNIELYFLSPKNRNVKKIIFAKKVIIAVGVVDLIDLLFRSKMINDLCCIELSEYSYSRNLVLFKFVNSPFQHTKKLIIRFNILRALCHMFGIQKTLPFNWLFNLLPFYVEQHFYDPKKKIQINIKNGNLIDKELVQPNKSKFIFGQSIHYCDLKINGKNINNFLKDIHPGLIGLGMAFVKQKEPGPISNDIAIDAIKKLKDF
jgi:hypothetical protein